MKKTLPETFRINIFSQEHSKVVQQRLFDLGYAWNSGGAVFLDFHDIYPDCQICCNSKLKMRHGSKADHDEEIDVYGEEITTDDLFQMEKPKKQIVQLNSEYSDVVSKDGIKVGCQTFNLDIVEKLANAVKEID